MNKAMKALCLRCGWQESRECVSLNCPNCGEPMLIEGTEPSEYVSAGLNGTEDGN